MRRNANWAARNGAPHTVTMTEKDWQSLVVACATAYGWWSHHEFDSRRSSEGWPDLTLIRGGDLLFIELKSERDRLSPAQVDVLARLRATGRAEVYVCRPSDEAWLFARLAAPAVPGQLSSERLTGHETPTGEPVPARPPASTSDDPLADEGARRSEELDPATTGRALAARGRRWA